MDTRGKGADRPRIRLMSTRGRCRGAFVRRERLALRTALYKVTPPKRHSTGVVQETRLDVRRAA